MFRKMSTYTICLGHSYAHKALLHELIQNGAKDNLIVTYLKDQSSLILLVPEQKKGRDNRQLRLSSTFCCHFQLLLQLVYMTGYAELVQAFLSAVQ